MRSAIFLSVLAFASQVVLGTYGDAEIDGGGVTGIHRRQGNSACAQWCATNFQHPGSNCTSLAANGTGPCYVCGPKSTDATMKLCSGACADTKVDNNNCGTCGNVCSTGETCKAGVCVLPITNLTGVLRIDHGGSTLGYAASDPNYWTPILTSDPASALVVTFEFAVGATSATGVEFKTDPGSNHGYPFLGLVNGRDSNSDAQEAGSFNYLYVSATTHTPSGSTPQLVSSFFKDTSHLAKASESSVWNVDIGTRAVTVTWINPNGSAASNVQLFVQSNHLYAGADPAAFEARFPAPVTIATLTFIPS